MKLEDYKKKYMEFSKKASDISRQLAFAGIAILWIFKVTEKGIFRVPDELILPGLLFVITLALDLSQYLAGTIIWGALFHYQEHKNADKKAELSHSYFLPGIIWTIFILKMIIISLGYYKLLHYIYCYMT
ncbi:MAG: hypothetical protein K9K88_04955 [Desulfobacterales bacterium]|nr:hypothetical protein [Desulfobacterales bacterium]